jgi:NADH-quinone oxidoreductase subunit I
MKYINEIIEGIKSLLSGMLVTLKACFEKPITLQYPDERPEIPLRFRGRLVMPVDIEKNKVRCIACMMCVNICPNKSLSCEKETTPDGKPIPYPKKYEYNLGSCLFCNLCVEICPVQAIIMSDEYELSSYSNNFIMDLLKENYQISGNKGKLFKNKLKEV